MPSLFSSFYIPYVSLNPLFLPKCAGWPGWVKHQICLVSLEGFFVCLSFLPDLSGFLCLHNFSVHSFKKGRYYWTEIWRSFCVVLRPLVWDGIIQCYLLRVLILPCWFNYNKIFLSFYSFFFFPVKVAYFLSFCFWEPQKIWTKILLQFAIRWIWIISTEFKQKVTFSSAFLRKILCKIQWSIIITGEAFSGKVICIKLHSIEAQHKKTFTNEISKTMVAAFSCGTGKHTLSASLCAALSAFVIFPLFSDVVTNKTGLAQPKMRWY